MIGYGSGDIGDVLFNAECRVHKDTEVFDLIGACIGWISMIIGVGVAGDGLCQCI